MKLPKKVASILLQISGLGLLAYVLYRACLEFFSVAWGKGTWLGQFSPKLGPAFFFFVLICSLILLGYLFWLIWPQKAHSAFRTLAAWRDRLGWWRYLLAGAVMLIPMWVAYYTYWGGQFIGVHLRWLLLFGMASATATLIAKGKEELFRLPHLAIAFLLIAACFHLGANFQWVRGYPFGLSWSEGNRIWDYSALFGHRLYDYPADKPIFAFIDLGRQALWGLPFIIPRVTIWEVRLWDALITSLPYALLGWLVFPREKGRTALWCLLGVWSYVFIVQGPIYTPLVLSAILVALAWRRPLWVALPLIVLAGYYAQLTRFTWMFAPAIWAGVLYFVDSPQGRGGLTWRKAAITAALFLAGALGGYVLPHLAENQPNEAASLTSDTLIMSEVSPEAEVISVSGLKHVLTRQPLLWQRLLPNPTYNPGILLGLLMATGPLMVFLAYLVWTGRWRLDRLQGMALAGSLLLFLGVGLVVSVKIGGGSNLHNLDMFLLGLVFAAALAWRAGGGQALIRLEREPLWVQGLLVVMMFVYAYPPVLDAQPLKIPAQASIDKAINRIREEVEAAKSQGEVLFMDQRQLLTFGYISNVPLVVDYEKKYMMDKAMAEDAAYFQGFYQDLANRRFSLIVSEPIHANLRESEYQFGDENNAWVKWVSKPLLCYYKPLVTLREVKVQLLVPRGGTRTCPDLPTLQP